MEKLLKVVYKGKVTRETWNGIDYSIGGDNIITENMLYDFINKNVKLTIEELPDDEGQ